MMVPPVVDMIDLYLSSAYCSDAYGQDSNSHPISSMHLYYARGELPICLTGGVLSLSYMLTQCSCRRCALSERTYNNRQHQENGIHKSQYRSIMRVGILKRRSGNSNGTASSPHHVLTSVAYTDHCEPKFSTTRAETDSGHWKAAWPALRAISHWYFFAPSTFASAK
eukprot:85893-Pleurochrysis_carterae.AAC.1